MAPGTVDLTPALEPSFKHLCTTCKVPEAFIEWLIKEEVLCTADYAIMAATEEQVTPEILDAVIGSDSKPIIVTVKGKISVKKLWLAAKQGQNVLNLVGQSVSGPGGDNAEALPKDTEIEVKDIWRKTHGFVLPESWLLVPSLQVKIRRGLKQDPPNVDVLLIEALRPLSCSDKASGTQLACIPGRAVETQHVIADMITKPLEIFQRIRAYFMIVAYVSIRNQSFLDLLTAIYMSEKVLELVTQTFKKQLAPPHFYIEAWATTAHYLAESLRVSSMTYNDSIKALAAWEHNWKNYVPTSGHNDGGGGGASSGPDLPKNVQFELDKARNEARMWQKRSDGFRTELNELRTKNDGGRKPEYKNKGDKGHGKRKYENKEQDRRQYDRGNDRDRGGRRA